MTNTLSSFDNESLLQALLRSHGHSIVFTFDQELRCSGVETEQQYLFGKSTDKLVDRKITEVFTTDINSQLVPLLITVLNGQSATGNICTFSENYAVIAEPQYDHEEISGGVVILKPQSATGNPDDSNDVNYWNAVWNVIPDMLFRVNRQGVFVDFRASETAGLYSPPHEFLGKPIEAVFPSELAMRTHNALSTLFDVGIPISFPYSLPTEDGRRLFFEARFVLAGDDDALIIVRDITEQHQYEVAIRQSERRFRQLTETAVDLIATHDLEGNLLYINPAGISMLALDPEKVNTYNIVDFITPDMANQIKTRQQERYAENSDTFRYELDVVTNDQQRKTLDVSSTLISDTGNQNSILVIARDITERKQTEYQLRAQATQIELFLQNTHDGLIICKRDGTILDVNRAYCAMTGRSQESLLGINVNDITVGLTESELQTRRDQLYQYGSVRFRARHRHQDGHLIDLEISVYIVSDEEEREYIFMRDTTAENMAIASTERSAKRLAILHNIDAAILSAHDEYEIAEATLSHIQQLVSCFTTSVLIFDFDDDIAQIIASLPSTVSTQHGIRTIPLDHLNHLNELMTGQPIIERDLATNTIHNATYDAIRQLGIRSFITVPIRADGQLIGALSLSHLDVNAFNEEDVQIAQEVAQSLAVAMQQVRLHQQIRLYAAELEELVAVRTDELQSANDRLLELDHLKSKFVSDVSHEFRTPVNNLMMRLHLLEHDTPDQQAVHLKHLKDQIGYLAQLVDDILQISRLEVDKGSIHYQDVDINEVVEQVYQHHQSSALSRNLSLKQELSSSLPIVIGDQASLIQALGNLVSNGLTYTETGHVIVRTRFDERTRHVAIQVEDSGMGIDPTDLPHIFERFYRGSTVAKSKITGTGLGLGIAQEIIKLHQGRIEVETELGKGTCFTIWLPAIMENLFDR